jgi:hypothetical protein
MRKIISLICFLLPVLVHAAQTDAIPQPRSDAPDQYVVVKGDTLWGISGKFFNNPWKWHDIWGMNKDLIKNPHWIYPGDTISLDRKNGTLRIGNTVSDVIKLSPSIQSQESVQNAIPSIPYRDIEPFLNQPLVEDGPLSDAPTLVAFSEGHVFASLGDTVYVKGITQNDAKNWQIYRPGKTFLDPETHEVLGHEVVYLGSLIIKKPGEVSSAQVTAIKKEINLGDMLILPVEETARNYLPRAPETQISARVISIYGDTTQAGAGTVITINKGSRDGVEVGHVLALSNKGRVVTNAGQSLTLPDDHFGLLFVFRVFDKVSYALVMQASLPVQVLDYAKNP